MGISAQVEKELVVPVLGRWALFAPALSTVCRPEVNATALSWLSSGTGLLVPPGFRGSPWWGHSVQSLFPVQTGCLQLLEPFALNWGGSSLFLGHGPGLTRLGRCCAWPCPGGFLEHGSRVNFLLGE